MQSLFRFLAATLAAALGPVGTGVRDRPSTPIHSQEASGTKGVNAATGQSPLRGSTIVIDPGHNGANATHPNEINEQVDIGNGRKACNSAGTTSVLGLSEHRFNWLVAGHAKRVLEAAGAEVILTHSDDRGVGPCVDRRAKIANTAKADLSISIHADGGPSGGRGFHVILPGKVPQVSGHDRIVNRSAVLGRALRTGFRSATGMPYSTYLGSKGLNTRTDLGGLNLLRVPGVMSKAGTCETPPMPS